MVRQIDSDQRERPKQRDWTNAKVCPSPEQDMRLRRGDDPNDVFRFPSDSRPPRRPTPPSEGIKIT